MDIQGIIDLIQSVGFDAAVIVALYYLIVKDNKEMKAAIDKLNDTLMEIKGYLSVGRGNAEEGEFID